MSDTDDIELLTGPHLPPHFYIHVPFCASKCSYCDFASVAGADGSLVAAVFAGLRSEVRRWAELSLPGVVETVYVGGGTPTHVAGQTAELVASAISHLPLREGCEITVEGNPESLSEQAVRDLAVAGATRISVGMQSLDDGVLRMLGRPHSAADAEAACRRVAEAGLALSVDLICGVPGQTISSWESTLDRALKTGAQHMSIYPLALEEGTPLEVAVRTGLEERPDPDLAADMMLLAEEVLARGGLARYEVANYARVGEESRHNTAYWTGREYAGVGPSAHGMLDVVTARGLGMVGAEVPERGRVRYAAPATIEDWLTADEASEIEVLTADEARREDVMLGLRLTRGVAAQDVRAASLEHILDDLSREGLVELVAASGRWRTTTRGWLLGNEVFRRIWTGE